MLISLIQDWALGYLYPHQHLPPACPDLATFYRIRRQVIMVSLVGPQNVRVIYACIDGLRLCIMMSSLCVINPTDESIMLNIASVLLSQPPTESA
ncbi:hypothetical protein BJX64DRAFT_20972 [Aspergillus heterothallicus]